MPIERESQAEGLSEAEALLRLKTEGYNELPSAKPRSPFAIALDVVREPMFLLLVACAVNLVLPQFHRQSVKKSASLSQGFRGD